MALAKYFSKDLLAINRLINTSPTLLTDHLREIVITVAFDEQGASFEGKCGLDMLIRLLSRLYPKIKVLDLSGKHADLVAVLIRLAKSINSEIEIVSDHYNEDFYILAGLSNVKIKTSGSIHYFGSDNWRSKYSRETMKGFGESENPIGAGFAACIVASNVFRVIFAKFLPHQPSDRDITLSIFSLSFEDDKNPRISEVPLNDLILAGVGAVGNGVIWALSRFRHLTGSIHLVDDEAVSLSNLQRYVLFGEDHVGQKKVHAAISEFSHIGLDVKFTEGPWAEFAAERQDLLINCVAVAIDNEKGRIHIQSSLPKFIFNAFTEAESIGITRHLKFGSDACLACSHIPEKRKKDFIVEIAENCNIPDKAEYVKICYNLRQAVDALIPGTNQSLLEVIAQANKISLEEMAQFRGMKLEQFYSDFVCGGIILKARTSENAELVNVDAPLAFQSAMAGVLLAAELVKHFTNAPQRTEIRTDIYHLSPLEPRFNPYHRPLEMDQTGRCICRDEHFVNRYEEKYGSR